MTGTFWGSQMEFPPGMILPWASTSDTAPDGWVYCDGNNGTPDLRDTYPKCVPDGTTDPGSTGGQQSVTLTESQLPAHSHSVTVSTDGQHNHGLDNKDMYSSNDENQPYWDDSTYNHTFNSTGSHSHPITSSSTGGNSSINNEPSHKTITFIMRI